jgi:hypothetical protein
MNDINSMQQTKLRQPEVIVQIDLLRREIKRTRSILQMEVV